MKIKNILGLMDELENSIYLHKDSIRDLKKLLKRCKDKKDIDIIKKQIKKHKKELKKIKKELKKFEETINNYNDRAFDLFCESAEINEYMYSCKLGLIVNDIDSEEIDKPADETIKTEANAVDDKNNEQSSSTVSKKNKTKRINLGKNVEYTDSVEFSSDITENLVDMDNKHVNYPSRASVVFKGSILGYINMVSDKKCEIEKDSLISSDIKEIKNKRLKEIFIYSLDIGLLEECKTDIEKYTDCFKTKASIEFTSLLDAILFLTGGSYGLDYDLNLNVINTED